MATATQIAPVTTASDESSPIPANLAVARCMNARERVYQEELVKGTDRGHASLAADVAYRDAMPPLSDYENIRDFIACLAHAMLIGVIRGDQGNRLLYASQVALSTVRCRPATSKPSAG